MTQKQKKNMVIVCCDEEYLKSIEYHLAKALCDKVDLCFITNKECLCEFNKSPKDIDILFIENELYQEVAVIQNCKQIFLLVEQENLVNANKIQENITPVYKYSSVRSMIDVLAQSLVLDRQQNVNESTRIISIYSPNGGCGKTTVALGLASVIGKRGYKTLYISTDMEQDYQFLLEDAVYMPDQIGYQCKMQLEQAAELMLQNAKNREFVYFPAWKRILPAYGIEGKHMLSLATLLQKKNIYDYIVVELTCEMQEDKMKFLNQSDSVVMVTKQDKQSVSRLQKFLDNIVEWQGQAVIVNNFYQNTKPNYLEMFQGNHKYTVCENIEMMQQEPVLQELLQMNKLEMTATAIL